MANETNSRKSNLPKHKKLKLSSSGNIFNDNEKRIYKKIDLKSANMKLKQSSTKNKHLKHGSNSRGNANKYKQSSNKKSRNHFEGSLTE